VNPDAYLLAEIWEDPTSWLGPDFDGATDYEFRTAVERFLLEGTLSASAFARCLEACAARQATLSTPGMCNLVGSHDTPRLWTLAKGDERLVRMTFTLLFAFPGVPCIYYGDETGLEGGPEPDNRRAMEWDRQRWNTDLRSHIRELAAMRRSSPALRGGNWETVEADDERGRCVFRRHAGDDECLLTVDLVARDARVELRTACGVR
jgi:glycosidase